MERNVSKQLTKRNRGFSLIEVLVTIVVLSGGMLGIAALYVESLKSGHTALSRTKAINLAADMADRIRANREGQSFYQVNAAPAGPAPALYCGAYGNANAVECTEEEMAQYDIWLWKTQLGNTADDDAKRSGLANGRGVINRNTATNPTTYSIRITWTERNDNQAYQLSFAL